MQHCVAGARTNPIFASPYVDCAWHTSRFWGVVVSAGMVLQRTLSFDSQVQNSLIDLSWRFKGLLSGF